MLFGKKDKQDKQKLAACEKQIEELKRENARVTREYEKKLKQCAEDKERLSAEILRLNKKAAKAAKQNSRKNEPLKAEKTAESVQAESAAQTIKVEGQAQTLEHAIENAQGAEKALAGALYNEALERYRLEIKRLKEFIVVWERALLSDQPAEVKGRKAVLVSALKEILSFNEQECTLSELSGKVASITSFIAGGRREEEGGIDLNEVLNPSVELNLEELCKELGVME